MNGIPTVASIPIAGLRAAMLALPLSLLVLRLRGGDFATATGVVSDATMLVISSIAALGGGTAHAVHDGGPFIGTGARSSARRSSPASSRTSQTTAPGN